MLKFYVGRTEDNAISVHYGNSPDEVLRHAKATKMKLVNLEERESPIWHIVEPIMCSPFMFRGQKGYTVKSQLLANGVIGTFYRCNEYIVTPEIFGKDRRVKQDGKTITAIGEVTFTREGTQETHKVYLEPIDEQHAIDLLDGVLIAWDAELADKLDTNLASKLNDNLVSKLDTNLADKLNDNLANREVVALKF